MAKVSNSNPQLDNVLGMEENGLLTRRGCGLFDNQGRCVAATGDDPELVSPEEQEFWAKRILTSVNHHHQLVDACNGLLGLLQLISGRNDVTDELKGVLKHNHRVIAAENVLATLEPTLRDKDFIGE